MTYICPSISTFMAYSPPYFSVNGLMILVLAYKNGWMDELKFYVLSTVFQSFRDDGMVNMKGSVQ